MTRDVLSHCYYDIILKIKLNTAILDTLRHQAGACAHVLTKGKL